MAGHLGRAPGAFRGARSNGVRSLAAALLREIAEETGLTVAILGMLEIVGFLICDEAGTVTHHHVLIDFTARHIAGDLRAGSDAMEARWVPYARLGDYELWSETRRIIDVSARSLLAVQGRT